MQIFVRDRFFYVNTVRIAVPVVLQSLITIGVNMMDTLMLGSFGETQLSGSSLANEFINIFSAPVLSRQNDSSISHTHTHNMKNINKLIRQRRP